MRMRNKKAHGVINKMATGPQRKRTKALTPSDCESDVSEGSSSSSIAGNKKRQFLQHWLKLYPWLEVEGTGEDITVFCRDCKKAKLTNEFSKGKKRPCSGWKKEYLQRHADSNQHTRHAQVTLQMVNTVKSHGFFPAVSKSATERETLGLLHNIYFALINGLPVYKSEQLHHLTEFQLKFFSDDSEEKSRSCLSMSHRTKYSTWEFVHAINSVVEHDDILKLRDARFFSLLLDESNDISVTKNLMVYTQFVNYNSKSIEVMFLKNVPLHSCDADSIVSTLLTLFDTIEVHLKKMVMFTSDGAPVMLGCNNGAFIKLKTLTTPHLIEYHCVAHKEALAVGQAYKSISYFTRVESTIKSIYSFFSHSSVFILSFLIQVLKLLT